MKAAIARTALQPWIVAGKVPPPSLASEEDRNRQAQRDIKREAELFEQARDKKSAAADRLLHQHHHFAESVALLQVGIALGAMALTHKRAAWWASLALGLGGAVIFAFTLFGSH